MKSKILSIACAIMIVVSLLSVGIISASADTGIILPSAISGALDSTMWDPASNIVSGALSTGGNKNTVSVTSVEKYNLGTDWTASMDLVTGQYWTNNYGSPSKLIVGEVEAIVYDAVKSPAADPYIGLNVKGTEVETYALPSSMSVANSGHSGTLVLDYDNGNIKVTFKGDDVITYDASGDALDFGMVNLGLSVKGNYSGGADKFSITGFTLDAANVGTGSSSTPASSTPTSSEPASSEPASSTPASSEPASSTPASSEPASSTPASSTASASAEKVTTAIEGKLVAEMWQQDPAGVIASGAAGVTNDATVTLTSAKTYDLTDKWEAAASYVVTGRWLNMNNRQTSFKIGDIEVVHIDGKVDSGTQTITEDGKLQLKVKGQEVKSIDITYQKLNAAPLEIKVEYNNGVISVYYSLYEEDEKLAYTYDATAKDLDFSNTTFVLATKADDSGEKGQIKGFSLTTSDTAASVGEPIETITDGVFSATDWSGDTDCITSTGKFQSGGRYGFTITKNKLYNLSAGFKISSKLTFKNSFTNYYGENAAIYIGKQTDGIELRIANKKGSGLYSAHIFVKGQEVATADLLNAPNGVYELIYKDGKVSVNHDEVAVNWTLADTSNSTQVAVAGVDLSAAEISFHIEGNYHTSARNWAGFNFAPVTTTSGGGGGQGGSGGSGGAGGVGGTGDARSLVIPAAVMVLGVCAAAFVAKSRKAEA